MSQRVIIEFEMEIRDGASTSEVAERMFDYHCEDPHDLFPEVEVVFGLEVRASGS